jgi:hypothetical protein
MNILGRHAVALEIMREAVSALSPPVSFDPAVALDAALDRAASVGLAVEEVKGLAVRKPECAPLFLLALLDQVLVGAVEQIEPGRFRFTVELLDGRREARERAQRDEASTAERQARQRLATAQQDAIDRERQTTALQGPEWAHATKAFGWDLTSKNIDLAQGLYTFMPSRFGQNKHAFRCTYCGAEGALGRLPRSLTHLSGCLTATRTPAYAAATR